MMIMILIDNFSITAWRNPTKQRINEQDFDPKIEPIYIILPLFYLHSHVRQRPLWPCPDKGVAATLGRILCLLPHYENPRGLLLSPLGELVAGGNSDVVFR